MSAEDERERNPSRPGAGRDPALERAWNEASREQPPPSVDARILAAARASARAERPRDSRSPRWWAHWQPMLAAAAVAGLAFVLVPLTSSPPPAGRATEQAAPAAAQSPGTAPVEDARPEAPAAGGDVAGPQPLLREPDARAKPAGSAGTASGRESSVTSETVVPRAPAASPPPPPSAAPEQVFDDAAPVDAATAPTAQRREKGVDRAAVASDAAAWVQRIATAYRRGDLATATAELRAFRAVEPSADDLLPEDLRDWARTVQ